MSGKEIDQAAPGLREATIDECIAACRENHSSCDKPNIACHMIDEESLYELKRAALTAPVKDALHEATITWLENEDKERDPDDLYTGRRHRVEAVRALAAAAPDAPTLRERVEKLPGLDIYREDGACDTVEFENAGDYVRRDAVLALLAERDLSADRQETK